GGRSMRVRRGQSTPVRLTITNVAATRWLAGEQAAGGWTRLGAHLLREGEVPVMVDFDWLRVELPHDVSRDERIRLLVNLPPIDHPGRYRVVFDLVIEGTAWFVDRGSKTATLLLDVEYRRGWGLLTGTPGEWDPVLTKWLVSRSARLVPATGSSRPPRPSSPPAGSTAPRSTASPRGPGSTRR